MSSSEFWLTTDRLALRRFGPNDQNWLTSLYADLEVTRYLGGTKTPAQVEEMMASRILRYYEDHPGLGIWMTLERATGDRIGFHLLNNIHGESTIQVGFALHQAAWGRGFATEMGRALVAYAFRDLRLARLAGTANLENLASQHVLQKIGLRRRGERVFTHPAYASQGPMAFFERDRFDWLEQAYPAASSGRS